MCGLDGSDGSFKPGQINRIYHRIPPASYTKRKNSIEIPQFLKIPLLLLRSVSGPLVLFQDKISFHMYPHCIPAVVLFSRFYHLFLGLFCCFDVTPMKVRVYPQKLGGFYLPNLFGNCLRFMLLFLFSDLLITSFKCPLWIWGLMFLNC